VVIGAAVFATGTEITVEDLPEELRQTGFSASLSNLSVLSQAERTAITRVLKQSSGQMGAAEKLGISKRTLQRRIKSYGLKMERGISVKT
jgi:transcriptional regulator of acetoin/glycerol metabolism